MINVFRKDEPIKNSFKKKILSILDKLYGAGSPQIKRMMKLFSRYNYSNSELLCMLGDLERELALRNVQKLTRNAIDNSIREFQNFDDLEKDLERIKRRYRL